PRARWKGAVRARRAGAPRGGVPGLEQLEPYRVSGRHRLESGRDPRLEAGRAPARQDTVGRDGQGIVPIELERGRDDGAISRPVRSRGPMHRGPARLEDEGPLLD